MTNTPLIFVSLGVFASAMPIVIWIGVKSRQRSELRQRQNLTSYHCVMIKPAAKACLPVKAFEGLRLLPHEAPLLPLPKCALGDCNCRFVHFADRRDDMRRNPYGHKRNIMPPWLKSERRKSLDRRKQAS